VNLEQKLTVALPSGERSKHYALGVLRAAGLEIPDFHGSRSLSHEFGNLRIIEVKDPDVPVYVDLGVADCGIVGKDWILESGRDVFEPLDLGGDSYRLSLIGIQNSSSRIERVASKYARTARRMLGERGIAAAVIQLNGKLELAALTGLVDAIVDVVQTGRTLKENNLLELEVFAQLSYRLIVNRASLKLKALTLRPLIHRLQQLPNQVKP
jgi:ATP phosphoribosyltransferase